MLKDIKVGDRVYIKKKFWKIKSRHNPGAEEHMKECHGESYEVVKNNGTYLALKLPRRIYLFPIEWIELDNENIKFRNLLLEN